MGKVIIFLTAEWEGNRKGSFPSEAPCLPPHSSPPVSGIGDDISNVQKQFRAGRKYI